MFKLANAIGAAAIAAIIGGRGAKTFLHSDRYGSPMPHRGTPVGSSSIAQHNRWTGGPHEHKREIARRKRQELAIFDRNISSWHAEGTYQ